MRKSTINIFCVATSRASLMEGIALRMRVIVFLVILFAGPVVFGHSYVHCTDWNKQTQTCRGYIRNLTYLINGPSRRAVAFQVQSGTEQLCSGSVMPGFPAAKVFPGETLTLGYMANNHASEYVGGSTVQILVPSTSDVSQATLAQWNMAMWKKQTVLTQWPFGQDCYKSRVQPPMDEDRGQLICSNSFQIPTTWAAGERHTFVWYWFTNGGTPWYYSCFDVDVTENSEAVQSLSAPSFDWSWYSYGKRWSGPGWVEGGLLLTLTYNI